MGPKDRGSVALHYLEMHLSCSFAPEKGCRRLWWFRCSVLPSCRCCCCKCSLETEEKFLFFYLLVCDTITAVCVCTLQKMMQRINPPAVPRGIKTDLNINTHFLSLHCTHGLAWYGWACLWILLLVLSSVVGVSATFASCSWRTWKRPELLPVRFYSIRNNVSCRVCLQLQWSKRNISEVCYAFMRS